MTVGSYDVTTNVIRQWNQKPLFKILDTIQDAVLVLDSESTIVYANEAYAKIFGVPVPRVLGRRLDSIKPNTGAINCLRTGKDCRATEHLYPIDLDLVGNAFPLIEGNKIMGCISIFNIASEIIRQNQELQLTRGVADYLQEELNQREQLPLSFQEYIGNNIHVREILALAAKVAKTESTVLIRGESGVGKEVVARAIHNSSRRKEKHLIKVNCAAIPEALLESELFGYEDGAFTGARKGGKLGKFELAHGGTIFLDEIGDMSIAMQAKILRVLQEKELERLGGTTTVKLDIRIIAATNRDLEKMIEENTFRQDLYYRLNIVALHLPPLRERKDDILNLAQHFLSQFSVNVGNDLTLSSQVIEILQTYDWPGNVRELQNVLEHASVVCEGNQIEVRHLPANLRPTNRDFPIKEGKPFALKSNVEKLEKELILGALANCKNNRSRAMKELGITPRTFYERLRRYKIAEFAESELRLS